MATASVVIELAAPVALVGPRLRNVWVAAAWAMIRHKAMEIPYEIGTLHVAGAINSDDAVVICKEIEITDEQSTMDVAVRNLDGSLIMTLNGLVLKTIMTGE